MGASWSHDQEIFEETFVSPILSNLHAKFELKLGGFICEDADGMIDDRRQTTESLVYCVKAATTLIYFFLLQNQNTNSLGP